MVDEYIKTKDVAEILNCSVKTVKRYVKKGHLTNIKSSNDNQFYKPTVTRLKDAIDFNKEHPQILKTAYILYSFDVLENTLWYNKDKLMSITTKNGKKELYKTKFLNNSDFLWNNKNIEKYLPFYGRKRRTELSQFTEEPWNFYTVKETASRLDITDYHVIYGMLEDRLIIGEVFSKGKKKKNLITKQSFENYISKDRSQIFYGSDFVSALTEKTINKIDKIAKRKEIGRKINPHRRNSKYIFTFNEAMRFNGFRNRYR